MPVTGPKPEGELRSSLREGLGARLEPAGWAPIDIDSDGYELAAFVCPLDGEFAATAELGSTVALFGHAVWPDYLRAGVSYEPLRRLWPLLGKQFRVSVLDEQICENSRLTRVANEREAADVADVIAGLVLDRAVSVATPHASLEVLLMELRDDDEPNYIDYRLPALLAASGRFDDARAALARFRPEYASLGSGRRNVERRSVRLFRDTREAERFAHRLGRWIDSGGDPALLPSESPAR